MIDELNNHLTIWGATAALIALMTAASVAVRFVTRQLRKRNIAHAWAHATWGSVRLPAYVLIWFTGAYWLAQFWARELSETQQWSAAIGRGYGVGVVVVATVFLLSLLRQMDTLVAARPASGRGMRMADHVQQMTRVGRIAVVIVALLLAVLRRPQRRARRGADGCH